MKILQICSAKSLGGGERHLLDLVKGLVARGHDVHVAVRPNSPLIPELRPARYATSPKTHLMPLRNSVDVWSARALAQLVRRHNIQIVHAHLARDYPLGSYAMLRNRSARLIITRHVLFPMSAAHQFTLSQAARVIGVSKAVAERLHADRVAKPEKISVVMNGIDSPRFRKARAEFQRRPFLKALGLPPHSLLIGMVGTLTLLKGQAEFLKAAAQLRKRYPMARFIIAGTDTSDGNKNLAWIEALIEKLKLADVVKLVGWVEDLPQLYCALDIFVSASHSESFGLAIAEAMASGTAVVATETEGAREIIEHEQMGLLVPIGDVAALAEAIVALAGDDDRRRQMGAAAQQSVAERFAVDRMVDEIEKIYQEEVGPDL